MTYKVCTTCGEEKFLSQYRRDRTQTSGYQPRCKQCVRAVNNSAYVTKYGEKQRQRNSTRVAEQREKIRAYKLTHPCTCGEKEPVCLEFHHLLPGEKDFQMSNVGTLSWARILQEIQKCVVVCSNCHKKIHAGIISPMV